MRLPLFSVTTRKVPASCTAGSEIDAENVEFSSANVDDAETKRRVDTWLRRIAGAKGLGESREHMLRRVAISCDLKYSRIENLFSGEARRIDAWEYLRIEAAAKRAPSLWAGFRIPFPTPRR